MNAITSTTPLLVALWSVVASLTARAEVARTCVSIADGRWLINGEVTDRGANAEGLLLNDFVVNATFDDSNRPDFDPEANSDEFIAQNQKFGLLSARLPRLRPGDSR